MDWKLDEVTQGSIQVQGCYVGEIASVVPRAAWRGDSLSGVLPLTVPSPPSQPIVQLCTRFLLNNCIIIV